MLSVLDKKKERKREERVKERERTEKLPTQARTRSHLSTSIVNLERAPRIKRDTCMRESKERDIDTRVSEIL
jgi:hypothetical protein